MNRELGTPDSVYLSQRSGKRSTVHHTKMYLVTHYNNDKLTNQIEYYNQDHAENSAEDYTIEKE